MVKKRTNYFQKLSSRKTGAAGFTILELMIASSVFAVILLVIAVGVINFTNSYYKGIISSETQSVARTIMADISQSIEFGDSVTYPSYGNVDGLCVDNTLYAYQAGVGVQVTNNPTSGSSDQGYNGLITSNTGCSSLSTLAGYLGTGASGNSGVPSGSRELLNQHMRLGVFSVTSNGNLYTIQVRVIYGDDNLLNSTNWATAVCTGGAGSQFCAVSNLMTTVEQRLI